MSAVAFMKRRAMLRALGCGVAVSGLPVALAQGSAGVDGPSPHRLPLATIDDLEIAQPAELDGEAADLAVLALGIVDLPSGQFVGVDGLLLEGAAFVPSVPPGRYPVQIVLARVPGGDERVAFMLVRLTERPAQRWSNALIEGEDPDPLAEDEVSVFEVESGVAGLFDATALAGWRAEIPHNQGVFRELEQVLRENRRPVWTWARVRAAGGSGFLVTAGLGAGEYAAYWGRDRDDKIVSLVLDFDLLDWAGLPLEPAVTA